MKKFNTNSNKAQNPRVQTNQVQSKSMVVLLIIITLIAACFTMVKLNGIARSYSQEEIEMLKAENEDNPASEKYLVTDTCISRVYPGTDVETFVTNFLDGEEVEVYKDEECTEKVTDGFVMSGMYAKYKVNDTTSRVYEISVLGDINEKESKTESGAVLQGDGVLNQIELTRDIRSCVESDKWKIEEEVEKKSADVNCNNQVDSSAVDTIINYIVFGELDVDEVGLVENPDMDILGNLNDQTVYRSSVLIRVTENADNALHTVYKISGDKEEDYKILTEGEEITLTENGTYKVTAYTYGILGNKSKRCYTIVTIDRNAPYTMEYYLEGLDGEYSKVESDTKTIEDGIIGDEVEIEPKQYTDYVLNVDKSHAESTGTVLEDGSLVLKAYYDRKSVTYSFESGNDISGVLVNNDSGLIKSVSLKWGEKINIAATVNSEAGYVINWSKWVNVDDENDVITSNSSEITIGKSNKTYRAEATRTINNYTIVYDLNNGTMPSGVINKTGYTVATESFSLNNPSRDGYIFEGWTGGVINSDGQIDNQANAGTTANIVNPSTSVTINSGSLGNRKYTAVWSAITTTPYKVEHYKETLTSGEFELAETENKQGTTDNEATAIAKDYEGFTYDENNANEVKTGTILANGKLVLKLYYTRNSYSLTIDKNENILSTSASLENVKYGQTVDITATVKSIQGYDLTWTEWKSSDTLKLADIPNREAQITMPAADITLTATASKVCKTYQIEYDFQGGLLPEGAQNQTTYNVESASFTLNNLVDKSKKGYNFVGWTGGVVDNDGNFDTTLPTGTTGNQDVASKNVVISTGSIGNRKYVANWEKANFNYVVKYHYEDAETVTSEPISAVYESTVSEFTARPKTGYKLRENPTAITISDDEEQNVLNVYYIKETYTVTLLKDDDIESVSGADSYKFDEEVNINAVLMTRNGYDIDFDKWETQTPELIGNQDAQSTAFRMPAGNITLKATSNKVAKNYTITYNLNGGELSEDNKDKYTVETETFTLNNPTKEGYVFEGWTGGTTAEEQGTSTFVTTPTTTLQVQKGSLGNRVYTANWEGDSQTKYTVKHYKEKVDGTYELAETQSDLTGKTDTVVTAEEKIYSGFEFDQVKSAGTKSGTVLPDGSLVLEMYYKRCFYTLTLQSSNNIQKVGYSVDNSGLIGEGQALESEEAITTAEFKYGAEINITATMKEIAGYDFTWTGWTSSNKLKLADIHDKEKEIIMPDADITLTATATKDAVDYSIIYDLQGGALPALVENKTSYNVESSDFTLNNLVDGSKNGYNFAGWTGGVVDNDGNFDTTLPTGTTGNQDVPSKEVVISTGSIGKRKYVANWEKAKFNYVVKYHYEDAETVTSEPIQATYETVIDTFTARPITGYKLKEDPTPLTISYNEAQNILDVYYIKETYTLTLQKDDNIESISGSNEYKYDQEISISAVLKTENGYDITWNNWESLTPSLIGNQENQAATIRMPAGNITLKATGNKAVKTYTISYNLNNGVLAEENPENYNVETPTFTLHNPTKQGYVFAGWTGGTSDENQGTSTFVTTPTTTLQVQRGSLGNRVYTANWVGDSQTKYTVKHYKEKLDGTYELAETENNLTGTTDSTVYAQEKTYDGFEFNSEKSAETKSGKVLPDGSLVLEMYYDRCFYTLTLQAGENVNKVGYKIINSSHIANEAALEAEGTEVSAEFKYGAPILILSQMGDKTGYTTTWSKWESSDNSVLGDQDDYNQLISMPVGTVTLTAKADRTINKYGYRIEYYYDDEIDSSKTEVGNVDYGTVVNNPEDKSGAGFEEESNKNVNNPLTVSEVESNNVIKIYYKHIDYTITYDYNGGELPENTENKNIYTVKTPTFTIVNPVRAGYQFEGWTGTNGTTPEESITIEKGQIGNREYYANWIANDNTAYKVEHYKETLTTGQFELAETENKYGVTDEEAVALNKNYDGFTYDENNASEVKRGTITADGQLVLKLYYTRNSYTLTIDKNENISSASATLESVKYGQNVSITATMKNTAGYDFTWTGWTSSNKLKLADINDKEKEIIMPDADITLTATATKAKIDYTITYDLQGGELPEGVENLESYNVESANISLSNPVDGSKKGYNFKGWTGGVVNNNGEFDTSLPTGTTGNQDVPSKEVVISTGSVGKRKYVANWEKAKFNYVVKYHYEDAETVTSEPIQATYETVIDTFTARPITGYKLKEEPTPLTISYNEAQNVLDVYYIKETYTLTLQKDDNIESVSGSNEYKYDQEINISAVLKTENGYDITWNNWESLTPSLIGNQENQAATIRMPAGNITLKATGNKAVKTYTISYNLNNGVLAEENPENYNVETPTFTLHNPTKQGYVFAGWTGGTSNENQGTSTFVTTPTTTLQIQKGSLGNRVYTANWVGDSQTKYTVKHYKEKLDGTYELAETENNLTGTTDSTVYAQEKTYDGFEFNSERSADTKSGKVLPDGSLVLEMYYDRCFYTLTLQASDYINKVGYSISDANLIGSGSPLEAEGTEVSAEFKYGAQINISAEVNERTGYTTTWSKWESSDSSIIVNQTESNPIIGMPIGSFTLTAKATRSVNKYGYRIEYYYDDLNDSSKTEVGQANYGSTVSNTKDKSGNGFEEDSEKNVNNPLTISEIELNNVIKIYYKHIDYTITYDYNGGALPSGIENKETYNVTTPTFIIQNPIRDGYTFEGWTGTNGSTPNETITIEKGQTGNKEYYANWIANTDTHYKVEHYKENLDGTYTKSETDDLTAETDSNVNAVAKSYSDYTLDANNPQAVSSGKVTADGQLVLKLYYNRNIYTLRLTSGSNIASVSYSVDSENSNVVASGYELTATGSEVEAKFKFGAQVTISATLNTEEYYDITNGKWESNNNLVNPSELNTQITIPTSDVALVASATKTGKTYGYYTNYYYDNELDYSKESSATYNTQVTTYSGRGKTGYEFSEVTGLPLTITSVKENNVINVYYVHSNYTIEYDLDGGALGTNEENPTSYNVTTETFTLHNPTKAGYTFLGWTGSNGETAEETVTIAKGTTGNKNYTANWRANSDIQYTVEHYIENLDSTESPESAPDIANYTLYQTQGLNGELIGTTDTDVTAETIQITGFTYSSSKSASTITGKVKADGTLVLKVFYTRNSYNLTLVAGENVEKVVNGGTQDTQSSEKSYKYGQTVSIGAVMATRDGYTTTWNQWESSNTSLLASINVANTNITMPAGNVTLTGSVSLTKAKFSYSAEFYYDGVKEITENGEPTDFGDQIPTYSTEGKERTGYVLDRVENLPLTITSNPSNNVIRYYYELEDYTIGYDLDGGSLGTNEENPTSYNVKTETFTLKNPTKAEHIFLGWTGTNGNNPESTITIEKGSTGNRNYTANWQRLAYKVIVHHYLVDTTTKVAEDELLTSDSLQATYEARNLIPTYNELGEITNEDKDIRNYLDGRELYATNTPANATGTYSTNDIEVTYYYQYYPAVRVISTDAAANDLVGNEYISVTAALQALEAKGLSKDSTVTKLQLLRNISDDTVLMSNKNVVLDLHGYTLNSKAPETIEVANEEVKQATIKLDNSKLQVIDESDLQQGKITSTNAIGVYIKTNSEFTLGIEAKPVEMTPEIIGKTVGVYKDIVNDEQGVFNFFDGKVTGKKAKNSVNATVDLMPILYKADTNPVTISGESCECLSLAVIENVEARIGRVTYNTLEDAINAANNTVAEDGSQVEIVLVTDISRVVTDTNPTVSPIIIDNTKNIKLDLDGHTILSSASDYAIVNKGLLEIVDSSATAENQYGTGKITNNTGSTILNTYSGKTFQREYTFSDFVCPSTYGFVLNETTGKIESTNAGVNNSTAYGYIYVDLRDKTGEYMLDVNAQISSQGSYDKGFGYVKTSSDISASGEKFIEISGEVAPQDYSTTLEGGNEYYIHFQYTKNKNTNSGSDTFAINSIKLRNKYYAELKLTSGTIENTKSNKKALENYGTMVIGNKNVTDIMPRITASSYSLENYKNLVFESGSINRTLYNYSNILIKGGNFSSVSLRATSDCSQVIEGGTFSGEVGIYVSGNPGVLTIKGGTFNDDVKSGCSNGKSELYITGGTFNSNCTVYNFKTSEMQITGGTFYGEVNTSDTATTTIDNGTFYNKLSFSSSNESTINKATINVTSDKSAIGTSNGTLNLYDVTASSPRATISNSTATVNIYRGTYSNSSNNTIYQEGTGTINIYGGEITNTSTNSCICNYSTGTINIGENDGTVSVEKPTITALSGIGVENKVGGTFNFYDGIINASNNNTIIGDLSSIADNVQLLITYEGDFNEIEVAKLGTQTKPVAQIGSQTYQTLESAIAAVPDNGETATTIKLLQTIYQINKLEIPEEKKIILDLNAKNIRGLTAETTIENNGELQIENDHAYNSNINLANRVDSASGFDIDDNGSLVSTNHGNNSSSNTYLAIDLTNVDLDVSLETKVSISSEANCDIGYARITNSADTPNFTDSNENLFAISGTDSTEKTFRTNLSGGNIYYLHYAYIKDNSRSKGDDIFKINSITLKSAVVEISSDSTNLITNNGKLNLKNIKIINGGKYEYGVYNSTITNSGELEVNGADIQGTVAGKVLIDNIDNGKLSFNSGKLLAEKYNTIGLRNSSTETAYINGGYFKALKSISNINQGNIVINNGEFYNYDSSGAIAIENVDGNITIKNGYINTLQYRDGIVSTKGIIHIENVTIEGSGSGITNKENSELIIDNGIIRNSISNEGTTTIKNGSFYSSIGSTDTLTIENGTFDAEYNISSYSEGTITITGGTFTGSRVNIQLTKATVTISNAVMTGARESISTYTGGNVTILSGQFSTTDTGSSYIPIKIANNSTVTLGVKDDGVVGNTSSSKIYISGKSYGIDNSGTFNFYEGYIEGATDKAIKGSVTDKESGYEPIAENIENSRQKLTLKVLPLATVASHPSETYTSLQSAVADCTVGENNTPDTITLTRDVILGGSDSATIISSGKNIIIDVAGHKLTASNELIFSNLGNVTFVDSSAEKTGLITNLTGDVIECTLTGKVTFDGIKVNSTNGYVAINDTINDVDVINSANITGKYGIKNSSSADINVNNSTINCTKDAIINEGTGTVEITAGDITGTIRNTTTGNVMVNSGTLYCGLEKAIYNNNGHVTIKEGTTITALQCIVSEGENGQVDIQGGTITHRNVKDYTKYGIRMINGTLAISGGTITRIDAENSTIVTMSAGEVTDYISTASGSSLTITGGTYNRITNNGTLNFDGGEFVENHEMLENNGTATIKNTEMVSKSTIIKNTGTLTLINVNGTTSNSSSSYCYGINNTGTVTLSNTTITQTADNGIGIYNSGTVNLGLVNEDPTNTILVSGTAIGISKESLNAKLNYNFGEVKGNVAVKGDIDVIPNNKMIQRSVNDNVETLSLVNKSGVLAIGNTPYEDLASAVANVPLNGAEPTVIKVTSDFSTTNPDKAVIASGKNIVLDLDGHTIYAYGELIENKGTLKIIDDNATKGGIIGYCDVLFENTGVFESSVNITQKQNKNMIENNGGTVKLTGGNISIDGKNGYYPYDDSIGGNIDRIGGNVVVYSKGVSRIELDGANIEYSINLVYYSNGNSNWHAYGIYSNNTNQEQKAEIVVSSGLLKAKSTGGRYSYGIYGNNTNVTVNGGTINANNGIYSEKGKITINAGDVVSESTSSGGDGAIESKNASLEITGGTISSQSVKCIFLYNSTMQMTAGTVSSESNTAIYSDSNNEISISGGSVTSNGAEAISGNKITIGNSQYPVSRTEPLISGATYGVNNRGSAFSFYDGKIMGGTRAINGTVNNKPDDYSVNYYENETVALLELIVTSNSEVEIGTTTYATLQSAINAADDEAVTITLIRNIQLSQPIQIASDQHITIDLNGKSIVLPDGTYAIQNLGELTIIDSLLTNNSSSEFSKIENGTGVGISNEGTLTLGIEDATYHPLVPTIVGGTYGITNNGTLRFFDGRVKGNTAPLGGNVVTFSVPNGYNYTISNDNIMSLVVNP